MAIAAPGLSEVEAIGRVPGPASIARASAAAWAGAAAVALAFAALFGPTLAELLADWAGSGEYGHGFLLLPLALWLAWTGRVDAPAPARRTGMVLVAGGVLLFLVGFVAAEYFTRRVSVLVVLIGLAAYYRGWAQVRAWWLPFALVLFTIPLPEVVLGSITLPLQLTASRIAVELLEFRHIPVALSGNIILLPGQELFVAEACSGLRSISALLGLTLLIGGTTLSSPWGRGLLLLLAVPAALAANALRVFATGFAAFYVGAGAAEGAMHEAAGLLVFGLALGVVGLAAWGLRRVEP